jgi:REP element-mobilizing transposase RayT
MVLRADVKSTGSLLRHRGFIYSTPAHFCKKFDVRVYEQGLASNHIHLVLKFKDREDYKGFIRAVSGVVAKTLNLKWTYRPFTKVIEWGRPFKRACTYAFRNEYEALGIVPYKE